MNEPSCLARWLPDGRLVTGNTKPPEALSLWGFAMVAGAGFEAATFGL